MLVQEGNLARASFSPWWDDVVHDELVLMKEVSFPHDGMMLLEMSSFLCKRKILHTLAFPHGGMMMSEISSWLCKKER